MLASQIAIRPLNLPESSKPSAKAASWTIVQPLVGSSNGRVGRGVAGCSRGRSRPRAERECLRGKDGSRNCLRGGPGWLLLLIQPRRRADFGTPAQSLVKTGHLQRWSMADEHLAWKVKAQATMLQATIGDAAREHGAFTTARPAQLVGATTAGAVLAGVTRGTIAAADGSQSPGEAIAPVLPLCPVFPTGFCGHGARSGLQLIWQVWKRAPNLESRAIRP